MLVNNYTRVSALDKNWGIINSKKINRLCEGEGIILTKRIIQLEKVADNQMYTRVSRFG